MGKILNIALLTICGFTHKPDSLTDSSIRTTVRALYFAQQETRKNYHLLQTLPNFLLGLEDVGYVHIEEC